MRTLTAVANAARQLRSYKGVLVCLKIEFPAPTGNIYFTSNWDPDDIDSSRLRKVVLDWGNVTSSLGESGTFPQSMGALRLSDNDGELRDLWETVSWQRLPFDLYWTVWTPGQAQPGIGSSTSILRGAINPPESWSEFDLSIPVSLTDYALRRSDVIELRVDKEDYANVWSADEGRIVPLVYGRPRGVSAIFANGGPVARLMERIDDDDTTIIVDDASDFPTGAITIAIGPEHIEGSFDGNTFTATERGADVATGTTTTTPTEYATAIDTNKIGDGDNVYAGYFFEVDDQLTDANAQRNSEFLHMMTNVIPSYVSVQGSQSREIVRFDSAAGKYEFARSFTIETEIAYVAGGLVAESNFQVSGNEVAVKAGVNYTIRTLPRAHETGEEIRLVNEPAQFIVGRGNLTVEGVYVYGKRKRPDVLSQYSRGINVIGDLTGISMDEQRRLLEGGDTEDSWMPVPPEYYTASHTTHAGTGDAITVVEFVRRPRELPGFVLETDDVLVDLKNATKNPADVIEDICNTYGGMSVDFSTVATDLTNWHMDFAISDSVTVLDLIADLAYQSRCALRWTQEDPELIYQYASGGDAVVSLDRSNILADMEGNSTFGMFRDDLDNTYSQVTVGWRTKGDKIGTTRDQSHTERDSTVESTIGRRNLAVNCWAYNSEDCPKALALYMLDRHKNLWRLIETDVTVYGMAIEPGDIVDFTHPALPNSPELGQIITTTNIVGRNPETADAIHVVSRQFHWPGCASTACQGFCQTSGCESGACQTNWQPATCWKCETAGQTACDLLGCQTAAQLLCAETTCQTAATNGCFMFCMPTVQVFGCGHCETVDCETANCQTTGCQTTNCQTTDCQTTDCQTTACQSVGGQ